MSLHEHEIVSIAFLAVYAILTPLSAFLWIKYTRAGYSWRYGFWGALLCCLTRLAAFISELIFYSQNYGRTSHQYGAYIAYLVNLSIGYIGLIDCEASLFTAWAEKNITIPPRLKFIQGKIRLIHIAALVLIIIASTKRGSNKPSDISTAATLTKVAVCLFLGLTVIQVLLLGYAWRKLQRFSETIYVLAVVLVAMMVRIVFTVYEQWHPNVSVFSLVNTTNGDVDDGNVGYLVGLYLVPEVIALVLMLGIGMRNVNMEGFATVQRSAGVEESHMDDIEVGKTHGVRA